MTTHIVEMNNKERDRILDRLDLWRGRFANHDCHATEEDGCRGCEVVLNEIEAVEKELEAFEDTHYTSHEE